MRSFAFYWSSGLGHESLNCAGIADTDINQLFIDLATDNLLNNSIVIVFSDHGQRYADIRETVC